MKNRMMCLIVLMLATAVQGAKIIENGSDSQTITVVIKDATGVPATGITIANLDLYCVRDGHQLSAKTDLAAGASDHAAWVTGKAYEIGLGLYRIDIPDANLSDGIGEMLTYVIDDAVGTNLTSFYEVQLGVTTDVYTVRGAAPVSSADIQTQAESAIDAKFDFTGSYVDAQVRGADDNVILDPNTDDILTKLTPSFAVIPTIADVNTALDTKLPADFNSVSVAAMRLDEGTVATAGTAGTFTLSTDFPATANAYPKGTIIEVKDADNGQWYFGFISTYTDARVVTLLANLPITPANADEVLIVPAVFYETPPNRGY